VSNGDEIGVQTHRPDARQDGRCWHTRYPKEADMPNGIFPVPQFHSHPSPAPALSVRLRTRWSRNRLDRELASGADPASSPELTLRAAQLQSPAVRSRLANAIVEMLGRAHEPNLGRFTVAGQNQNAEIREYAGNLRALVARLRDDSPIDIQGAAMTARLVSDRSSPLYRAGDQGLASAVLSTRLALDRSAQVRQDLATAA
jgi:hypothetical protein